MTAYPQAAEECIRDAALVREWVDSGLLHESQRRALEAGLSHNLRTLHLVFRILLFIFSTLILVAIVVLTGIQVEPSEEIQVALLLGFSAAASFVVSWLLAGGLRLYRCGAEEAAAVLGVLFSGGAAGFALEPRGGVELPLLAAVLTAAAASFAVYAVFGFRYMAVAAVVLAGAAPFTLNTGLAAERVLAALIFTVLFAVFRRRYRAQRHELRGPDYDWMQAFAWAGIYVVLHQQLPWSGIATTSGLFYWWTYLMIWVLPGLGLWWGIRDRDRILLDVSAVLALVTLMSNKPYLGWTRQTWDPILLGAFLIATAVVLRRTLARQRKGSYSGLTAERLLWRENRYIDAASVVSFAMPQPTVELPRSESGGRSGGAGASGNF